MNVRTKDGEPRLPGYGETYLITNTLRKFNQVSKPLEYRWHMPGNHVHTMINVWTRYGEPSCMIMDHDNLTLLMLSPLLEKQCLGQTRQKQDDSL